MFKKAKSRSIQIAHIEIFSQDVSGEQKWSYTVTLDGESLACSSDKRHLPTEASAVCQGKLVIKSQLYYDPAVTVISTSTKLPVTA